MAYNNDIGLDPVGDPTCLRKQKVGKPNQNAAQPYAKAEGCVYEDPSRADGLQKGWPFRVGTLNIDSLTGRSGELVEALGERRIDIAEGVGIFVAEKWVDSVVSVERHSERILVLKMVSADR